MADIRKNQNESINKAAEASRAGAREAANQTQDAVSAGVEGFKQVTDQFTRAFGFTGQSEEVTRRAAQNFAHQTFSPGQSHPPACHEIARCAGRGRTSHAPRPYNRFSNQ